AENLLRLPEFLVETACLLLQFEPAFVIQLGTEEIGAGNRENDAVEWPLRPVLLQQPQDRVPAAVICSLVVTQHVVARHVEHDALVEEVPVQPPSALVDQLVN